MAALTDKHFDPMWGRCSCWVSQVPEAIQRSLQEEGQVFEGVDLAGHNPTCFQYREPVHGTEDRWDALRYAFDPMWAYTEEASHE